MPDIPIKYPQMSEEKMTHLHCGFDDFGGGFDDF